MKTMDEIRGLAERYGEERSKGTGAARDALASLLQAVESVVRRVEVAEAEVARQSARATAADCARYTAESALAALRAAPPDAMREALELIAKDRDWSKQAPIEWLDLFVRVARKALAPAPPASLRPDSNTEAP